jgi:Zn-finger nucleic acid-binding protein
MNCPTCKAAMITLELADIEVDHCVNCGGIWLDAGELELLMGDSAKVRRLLDSFREDRRAVEQLRKCPICGKQMTKIIVGSSQPPLRIDKCARSDGLWFDRGELQDILNRGELDQDSRIQRLLADMFGQTGENGDVRRETQQE